jgi:circadian clock protein KaiB
MTDVVLKLYITGQMPAAQRAIQTARAICERYPGAAQCLEIIDVLKQPLAAEQDRILATPTLIREAPLPRRRLVGDLSDIQQVLAALGLDNAPDE